MTPKHTQQIRQSLENGFFEALNLWLSHNDAFMAAKKMSEVSLLAKSVGMIKVQDQLARIMFAISDSEDWRKLTQTLKRFTNKKNQDFTAPLLCLLGFIYLRLGDFPMATKTLKTALKTTPFTNQWEACQALGISYYYQGKFGKARDALLKSIAYDEQPHPGASWQLLGEVYWRFGDTTEARRAFDRAKEYTNDPYHREYLRLKLIDIEATGPILQSGVLPVETDVAFSFGIDRFIKDIIKDKLIKKTDEEALRKHTKKLAAEYETDLKSRIYLERFSPQVVAEAAKQNREMSAGEHRGRLLEEIITRKRQLLTCLKISMHGFTAHFKYLDPEEQLDFTNEFLRRTASVVFKYNGALDRIQTTNAMAYFGFMYDGDNPAVHRQAAIDAMHAAFELQTEMIDLFKSVKKNFFQLPVEKIKLRKGGYDLRERNLGLAIGLSTGWCVFGKMAVGDRNGRLMVGHTVNIAHRLTENGLPRDVLTSQTTYELVAHQLASEYEFEDITSNIEINGRLSFKQLKDYENRPIYKVRRLEKTKTKKSKAKK